MNIAITGSIAFDYIMTYPGEFREMLLADSLDHISVSFLVDEMSRHRGGVAANIAYTLALLGEHPVLVAAAGQDFPEYRGILDYVGVDTSGTQIFAELFTASFFVSTDRRNNQIASFYTGAMARAREIDLAQVNSGNFDFVVVSPNDPTAMENYVTYCKINNIPYMYDPSQQVARSSGDVLAAGIEGASMLVVNEYEFAALTSKTGLSKDDILNKVQDVIVTLGDKGAAIYSAGNMLHIPAIPEDRIVDPTGVGDAFRAGILKGMSAGWPWEISGRVGALAAVFVLEERGTQNHKFTPAQFVARFRKHFDDDGLLDSLLAT
jgi:adenosine kinase